LSADVVVDRSAKTPVSGAGEAGPDEVGEGEEAAGDDLLALAEGDVLAVPTALLAHVERTESCTRRKLRDSVDYGSKL